jgi:hypothetical protein
MKRMIEDTDHPEYKECIVTPRRLKLPGYEVEGNPAVFAAAFHRMEWNPEIELISKGLVEFTTEVGFKFLTANMLNGHDPRTSAMLGGGQSIGVSMGFEESAGFGIGIEISKKDPKTGKIEIERRFIPDKDGVVGSVLCIALQAKLGKQIHEIVEEQEKAFKLASKRMDIYASTQVKMKIINRLLEKAHAGKLSSIAGLELASIEPKPMVGGVYFDQFRFTYRRKGQEGVPLEKREFVSFIMRMSGTEPLVRVYVESTSPSMKGKILEYVQNELTDITIDEIKRAKSLRAVMDIISVTEIEPTILVSRTDEEGNPFVGNENQLLEAVRERILAANKDPKNNGLIDGDKSLTEVLNEFIGPTCESEDVLDAAVKVKYAGPVSASTIEKKLREFIGKLNLAAVPVEAKGVSEESAKAAPPSGIKGVIEEIRRLPSSKIQSIVKERFTEVLAASPDKGFAERCLLKMELEHIVSSPSKRLLDQIRIIKDLFAAYERGVSDGQGAKYIIHTDNVSSPTTTEFMIALPEAPNIEADWGSFLGKEIQIGGKPFPLNKIRGWSVEKGENTVLVFEMTDVNAQKLDDRTAEEVKRQLNNRK